MSVTKIVLSVLGLTILYFIQGGMNTRIIKYQLPPLLGSNECRSRCRERQECRSVVYDAHRLRCTLKFKIKNNKGKVSIRRRILAKSGTPVACNEIIRGAKVTVVEKQRDVRIFLKGNKFCNLNERYGFKLQKVSNCFPSSKYACRATSERELHKGLLYSWPMRVSAYLKNYNETIISVMLQTFRARAVVGFHIIVDDKLYSNFQISDWTHSKKRYVQGRHHNGTLSILLRCDLSITNMMMSIYDMTNKQAVMTSTFTFYDVNVFWLRFVIAGDCSIQITLRNYEQ